MEILFFLFAVNTFFLFSFEKKYYLLAVTNEDFKNHFSQYGSIIDSIVMINRETGISRRFGFVTFEDPAVATAIIENNLQPNCAKSKVLIAGKMCEVKASEPKTDHRWNSGNNFGRSGRGRARYYVSSPSPGGSEKHPSRTSSADPARAVSTLTSSALTRNAKQEQSHHGSTDANAIVADFEETEQGNQAHPSYLDDNCYYDQYSHPQNSSEYYYSQYFSSNHVPPPQMVYPYQYSHYPSQVAPVPPVPPVPPGPNFYNNQNAMMYGPTPAFNHFNYGNAYPQNMPPPYPAGGDDGSPIQGQGQGNHQPSNEA